MLTFIYFISGSFASLTDTFGIFVDGTIFAENIKDWKLAIEEVWTTIVEGVSISIGPIETYYFEERYVSHLCNSDHEKIAFHINFVYNIRHVST